MTSHDAAQYSSPTSPGVTPGTAPPPASWGPGAPVTGQPAQSSMPWMGQARNRPPELPINAGLRPAVVETQGNVTLTPQEFGQTVSQPKLSNVSITQAPIVDSFMVTGDITDIINWDVYVDSGPQSQVDITSPADGDITADNYRAVAHDLEPNDGGKPLRARFFASDLTTKHEKIHVSRHGRYFREGLELGLKWLNGRTASTEQQVLRLFNRMVQKIDSYLSFMTQRPSEEPTVYKLAGFAYRRRADEILRKGRAGDYP